MIYILNGKKKHARLLFFRLVVLHKTLQCLSAKAVKIYQKNKEKAEKRSFIPLESTLFGLLRLQFILFEQD